jgi:hypothetical protein
MLFSVPVCHDDPFPSKVASQDGLFIVVAQPEPLQVESTSLVVTRPFAASYSSSRNHTVPLLVCCSGGIQTQGHTFTKRARRRHGKSAWTFARKMRYLLDSLFSFSDLPIKVLLWVGSIGIVISLVFSVIVLWARLSGRIQVPGYSPIILTITFFGSINLICLGIVGSYVWRAYENTKKRPGAVVLREMEFN